MPGSSDIYPETKEIWKSFCPSNNLKTERAENSCSADLMKNYRVAQKGVFKEFSKKFRGGAPPAGGGSA